MRLNWRRLDYRLWKCGRRKVPVLLFSPDNCPPTDPCCHLATTLQFNNLKFAPLSVGVEVLIPLDPRRFLEITFL